MKKYPGPLSYPTMKYTMQVYSTASIRPNGTYETKNTESGWTAAVSVDGQCQSNITVSAITCRCHDTVACSDSHKLKHNANANRHLLT